MLCLTISIVKGETKIDARLEIIKAVAPYIVALVGMLGGIYAAVQNNRNQLTATYFVKMTDAYERHWKAFTEFVYCPNDETRNAYSIAVYNAVLYSTEDIARSIQALYNKAIEPTSSGIPDTRALDELAGELEVLVCKDVRTFRDRLRH